MNPDSDNHLGSSSFLTDAAGDPYQFVLYLPFGETFAEDRAAGYATPYRFNAKELDEETGLYYYGARYYDPRVSMWWGVDPLAAKYPEYSPYTYTLNNPVRYIDPDGMRVEDIIDIDQPTGTITVTVAAGNDVVRLVNDGKVVDSYTYGENGSFTSENRIITGSFDGVQGTAVVTANGEKAKTFYEFSAQSDVEYGKLDVRGSNGNSASVITTSHNSKETATLPSIVKRLSRRGFTGVKQSHSHPPTITHYNESVPSGHFDDIPGNPNSLMPFLKNGKNVDDALNALQVRSHKGFENTKFEVYAPGNNTTTTYDGVNRARVRKN